MPSLCDVEVNRDATPCLRTSGNGRMYVRTHAHLVIMYIDEASVSAIIDACHNKITWTEEIWQWVGDSKQ